MPEPQINGSAAAHSISNNDYGLGNEAIAIVGMGMRLPGGIHTSEALWKLLAEKQSTRGKVPPERFNIEAFYSPSGKRGSMKAEYAHFLASSDSLDHIDTSMFSMRKKEVEIVDPQAKMLLEVVFECMQNGGQKNWCGGDIGCFVGSFGEVSSLPLTSDEAKLMIITSRIGVICLPKTHKRVVQASKGLSGLAGNTTTPLPIAVATSKSLPQPDSGPVGLAFGVFLTPR